MKSLIRAAATLALSLCAMTASVAQPAPEKRVALLIGNDSYPNVNGLTLANVGRDMVLLQQAFRTANFSVETATNLTRAQTQDRLRAFELKAREADVAIVYFTGLGIEVDGATFFGGVDADTALLTPDTMRTMLVPISAFARAVQSARRFSMVMADGGRNDPFARATRSIAPALRVEDVANDSDVLIFYASAAGKSSNDGPAGGNGPFAAAVAKHMVEPNVEVGLFVRRVRATVRASTADTQRPALYGQLGDREFYFVGGPPPPPPTLIFSDQPRLALVIGNSDYNRDGDLNDDKQSVAVREQGFAPDLPNPANDARDMKAMLEKLRFEVDLVQNADNLELSTALIAFEEKIKEKGEDAIVVIYYAGHAIQVGGGNYLVPVGGKMPAVDLDRLTGPQAELVLNQYALPLQTALLGRLKEPSRRGLNLVILDACRENPWDRRTSTGRGTSRTVGAGGAGRTRGLGDVQIDLRRTAIAYATKPGDVAADGEGDNSPYTAALMAHLEEPGVSVIELLNRVGETVETSTNGGQVPWNNSPSLGRTCLGICAVQ